MRPLARLGTEFMASGSGYLVLGLVGLVGGLLRGTSPARAIVPFAVVGLVLALVQYRLGFGWLRRGAEAREPAPPGAHDEEPRDTMRRTVIRLFLYLVAMVAAIAVGRGLGAIFGGVAAGVGLVEVYAARWVAGRERSGGVTLLREAPASVFASAWRRRPLYTRPTSASTLAT